MSLNPNSLDKGAAQGGGGGGSGSPGPAGPPGPPGAPGAAGAAGADGAVGRGIDIIFRRSATQPPLPTGGSWDGTTYRSPPGWFKDRNPTGTAKLWACYVRLNSDNTVAYELVFDPVGPVGPTGNLGDLANVADRGVNDPTGNSNQDANGQAQVLAKTHTASGWAPYLGSDFLRQILANPKGVGTQGPVTDDVVKYNGTHWIFGSAPGGSGGSGLDSAAVQRLIDAYRPTRLGTQVQDLDMNTNRITRLEGGSENGDAVNVQQLRTTVQGSTVKTPRTVAATGGTIAIDYDFPTNIITGTNLTTFGFTNQDTNKETTLWLQPGAEFNYYPAFRTMFQNDLVDHAFNFSEGNTTQQERTRDTIFFAKSVNEGGGGTHNSHLLLKFTFRAVSPTKSWMGY